MSASPKRPVPAETAVLLALIVGGAFSYYHLGSGVLACGRDLAGREIYLWMAIAGLQSLIFLVAAVYERARPAYRIIQYLTVPLVCIPLGQLALAYPGIFVWLALLGGAYWYAVWLRVRLFGGNDRQLARAGIGAAAAETVLFLMAMLIVHSAIAFIVLHTPGVPLDDRRFLAIAAVSALVAGWIVRGNMPAVPVSMTQVPPLALLVTVLLRAKLPDGAYDSIFYKATLPIMIADWRTAITGGVDHTLLGTNFLEIVNSQLRIFDPAYPPSLISTLAFLALWLVAPLASGSVATKALGSGHLIAGNVLALLLVSLPEALNAAGTSYHEPMLLLLLAASLLSLPLAGLFLAAAIAVKITAVFAVPVILVAIFRPPGTSAGERGTALVSQLRSRRVGVAACILLAAFVVGEQFYRNLAYTGRVTGLTETLSSLTDPENQVLARPEPDPWVPPLPEGFRERYVDTFVHVLTLDRWIVPRDVGFHLMPASRLTAIAAVLAVLVLAFPALRRDRGLMSCAAAWLIGASAMLQFVWQGRYMLPLSFGGALLVAYLASRVAQRAIDERRRDLLVTVVLATGWLACGEQLVGSFINDGWECHRPIAAPVSKNNFDRPETALERRLADIVGRYRSSATDRGVVPTILCDLEVDQVRYVGAHYVYAYFTSGLLRRHLKAQPEHVRLLPTSLLAVCFTKPRFADRNLPAEVREQFQEVDGVPIEGKGTVRILVSKPLMSGARPTSLLGQQWAWAASHEPDLLASWGPELLTSRAKADAPGGHGAFLMDSGVDRAAVLLAPFSVAFRNVNFVKGRHLELEWAMPFPDSDGMGVNFIFEGDDGARAVLALTLPPRPRSAAAPAWEAKTIPLPPAIKGRGTLTVTATSPSGNENGDWVYFRQLRLR